MDNYIFWQMVDSACEPVSSSMLCKEIETSMVNRWIQITANNRIEGMELVKCQTCKVHAIPYFYRDSLGHCHKVCSICHTPV